MNQIYDVAMKFLESFLKSDRRKKEMQIQVLREDIAANKSMVKAFEKMVAEMKKPPKPFKMPKMPKGRNGKRFIAAYPVKIFKH